MKWKVTASIRNPATIVVAVFGAIRNLWSLVRISSETPCWTFSRDFPVMQLTLVGEGLRVSCETFEDSRRMLTNSKAPVGQNYFSSSLIIGHFLARGVLRKPWRESWKQAFPKPVRGLHENSELRNRANSWPCFRRSTGEWMVERYYIKIISPEKRFSIISERLRLKKFIEEQSSN